MTGTGGDGPTANRAPAVVAVHRDGTHRFSKATVDRIRLLPGLGVEGDAHAGRTVQHLSRVRRDPTQPNLRQVHLIGVELYDELQAAGHDLGPGSLGENVTTGGVDLLDLPTGTLLRLGADAVVEITGLRNPCVQIDRLAPGALKIVLGTDASGAVVRRAGVMGVVVIGGELSATDPVAVELPAGEPRRLEPV